MRVFLCLMVLLLPVWADAADLCAGGGVVEFPNANVTRGRELCDELRIETRVRLGAEWTDQRCYEEFARQGMRSQEAKSIRTAAQGTVTTAVRTALATFDTNHPILATQAFCGDSLTDSIGNYVEECDDGGVQTATCEVDCAFPACGDGRLNTLAGEVCDDGNTDDGDGCNSTCTGP